MPREFIIRPYEESDIDQAAGTMNAAARQAYAFFGWDDPVEKTKLRIAERQDIWTAMRVAVAGGEVVGFMALRANFIDQIFVAPPWQGHGVGALLMAAAKAIHPDRLDLDCFEENHPARRFYERHGFRVVGRHIHEKVGIGEVVYRWQK